MDKDGAAFNAWIDRTYGMDDGQIIKMFESKLKSNQNFSEDGVYQVTRKEMLKFARALIKFHKD